MHVMILAQCPTYGRSLIRDNNTAEKGAARRSWGQEDLDHGGTIKKNWKPREGLADPE